MIVFGNLERNVSGHIGIDPGAEGAIAVMYGGHVSKVLDMPMCTNVVGGKKRSVVDFKTLAEILSEYVNQNYCFTVEMTPVFITMQGGSSSSANWNLGYSQGFMTSFFLIKSASFRFVRTQEWHKAYDYKSINFKSVELLEKKAHQVAERRRLMKLHSLQVAQRIAPHIQYLKPGKTFKTGRTTKDTLLDGRCEAVLLANYGRVQHGK
jgi:hypothetical protein